MEQNKEVKNLSFIEHLASLFSSSSTEERERILNQFVGIVSVDYNSSLDSGESALIKSREMMKTLQDGLIEYLKPETKKESFVSFRPKAICIEWYYHNEDSTMIASSMFLSEGGLITSIQCPEYNQLDTLLRTEDDVYNYSSKVTKSKTYPIQKKF